MIISGHFRISGRFSEKSKCLKKKKKKNLHFASALFSKDMLRIVKGFAPWILFDYFKKNFYIHWSAGRSPRFHEVNPGRDPSLPYSTCLTKTRRTLTGWKSLYKQLEKARSNISKACLRRSVWDVKSLSLLFYLIWEVCYEYAPRSGKFTKAILSANFLASESLTPRRDNPG